MYRSCAFLFFFWTIVLFSQNITIKGRVSDKNNRSIQSASVSLFDENNNLLGYNFTNAKGDYSISFAPPKNDKVRIEISSLDYQKLVQMISARTEEYNFRLEEKATVIKEVVLTGKMVRTRQDTTSINTSGFENGTEQTVEDILKRLPGIEVTKDGTIKAHGKSIDKLLVEGSDMFDKNYKLLSKNLDAKVVGEVQIIDHYEDNPLFKKLHDSDKVALNLKLKKGLKNVWFGNVELGAATYPEQRWNEAANIGLLKKKIKFFYFGNYNNIGDTSTNLLEDNVLENNTFGEDRFEYAAKRIFNIAASNIDLPGKAQSMFNKSLLNSLSLNTKLNKNMTFRGVVYYANDRLTQNSLSVTNYNLAVNSFSTTENNLYRDSKILSSAELEFKYYPNAKNYFTDLFIVKNNPDLSSDHLLFNDSGITQNLKMKDLTFYNHFNHTLQLSDNKVLNNYFYFGNDHVQGNALLYSPFLNAFLNSPANTPIVQNTGSRISYVGEKTKLISKINKIDLTNSVQVEYNTQTLNNELIANAVHLSTYKGFTDLKQVVLSSENTMRYNLSKKIDITASLNFKNNNFAYNGRNSSIFILNPSLYFNLKKTKIGSISVSYSKNGSLPDINQLNNNFQLTDYRTFQKGMDVFKNLKNETVSLLYNFYNDEKRYDIKANFFYVNTKSMINTSTDLTNDFIFNSLFLTKGGDSYNADISVVNFIRQLKLVSKLETVSSWSNTLVAVNSNDFFNSKGFMNTTKYSATTYFKGKVNFDLGGSYNVFKNDFQRISTENTTKDAFVNIHYKFSKVLLLESDNSLDHTNHKTYYFSNLIANYTPKDSKFSYRIVMNNLFNENEYTVPSIDNYISNIYTVKLVPRYVLLSIKYRF